MAYINGNKILGMNLVSGGEEWRTIQQFTLTEDTNTIIFSEDSEGNPFSLKKLRLTIKGAATHRRLNTFINTPSDTNAEYVNTYIYSAMNANSAYTYAIYEIGEAINGSRLVTYSATDDFTAYTLADGRYVTAVISRNKNGDNTPLYNFKITSGGSDSTYVFLSGTEFIFEGVDE